jgi:hypothetical protein
MYSEEGWWRGYEYLTPFSPLLLHSMFYTMVSQKPKNQTAMALAFPQSTGHHIMVLVGFPKGAVDQVMVYQCAKAPTGEVVLGRVFRKQPGNVSWLSVVFSKSTNTWCVRKIRAGWSYERGGTCI